MKKRKGKKYCVNGCLLSRMQCIEDQTFFFSPQVNVWLGETNESLPGGVCHVIRQAFDSYDYSISTLIPTHKHAL